MAEACQYRVKAAELGPDDYSLVTAAASALRLLDRKVEAERWYRQVRTQLITNSPSFSTTEYPPPPFLPKSKCQTNEPLFHPPFHSRPSTYARMRHVPTQTSVPFFICWVDPRRPQSATKKPSDCNPTIWRRWPIWPNWELRKFPEVRPLVRRQNHQWAHRWPARTIWASSVERCSSGIECVKISLRFVEIL